MSSSTTANVVSKKVALGADGQELCVHYWNKPTKDTTTPAKSTTVFVIYHGYGAHGLYPTVRYAAELLANDNSRHIVVAADMRGHGQSPGLKGYIPSVETLLEDATAVCQHAIDTFTPQHIFLVGSSMGGTIALHVAQKYQRKHEQQSSSSSTTSITGVLLLAPMLKLSVSSIEQTLLSGLSAVFPQWSVIPSSSTNAEKQYRDPLKRQECEDDPYASKSTTMRIGSAHACVQLAQSIAPEFSHITVPLWIGVADEDVVVNNQGSLELHAQAASTDKTLEHYPALHGLLCEPPALVQQIHADILAWVHARQTE